MGADTPLDQPFDSGVLPELRAAVQAHACEAGMPVERAMDVVLAVHELMANAIRHGAGKGRLRVWLAAGTLRCQVDDEGAPVSAPPGRGGTDPADLADRLHLVRLADPLDQADPADPLDPWPVRPGHGLWVVRQVADRMEVVSGPAGTRATAVFVLPSEPA
jgi:Histidine kinase-like ATPase domain